MTATNYTSLLRTQYKLSQREASVLIEHFGLDGLPPMTLTEIARRDGVTRQRIHTIRTDALWKLSRGT